MKRLKRLLPLLLFPFSLWAQCAGFTSCTVSAATPGGVLTALTTINMDNTTLTLTGAGTINWSSGVTFNSAHPYTINCGGSVATTDSHGNPLTYTDAFTINDTFGGQVFDIGGSGASAEEVRLTGCTITATGATGNGAITVGGVVVGSAGGFRIDHNHFINTNSSARQFGFGVADHNLFSSAGNGTNNGVQAFTNFSGVGNNAWNSDTALGAYNFVFIENNTFLDGFANDCMVGGRYVVRFNTFTATTQVGGEVQSHATGSTQGWRGCRAWEIYNNWISTSFSGSYAFAQHLSGTGVQYNNTITGTGAGYSQDVATHVNRGELSTNYTQRIPPNGLGTCGPGNIAKTGTVNLTSGGAVTWVSGGQFSTSWPAGTAVVMNGTNYSVVSVASATSMTVAGDANHPLPGGTVSGTAYGAASAWDPNRYTNGGPCMDSLGTGKGDLINLSFPTACNSTTTDCTNHIYTGGNIREATEPFYLWNETLTNVGKWIGVQDPGGNIVNNQDFYFLCGSGNSSCSGGFTGAAGVGSGPLASRPASCTAGIVTGSPYNVNGQATGVAWWETDHNQLDYCYFNGTSNVWSTLASTPASYSPFPYPHPLVGGTPIATYTPSSIAFGPQLVYMGSAPQSVTLQNTGTATLNATGFGPTNSKYYVVNNTCGGPATIIFGVTTYPSFSLAASASCTFGVVYQPQGVANVNMDPGGVFESDNTVGGNNGVTFTGVGFPAPAATSSFQ